QVCWRGGSRPRWPGSGSRAGAFVPCVLGPSPPESTPLGSEQNAQNRRKYGFSRVNGTSLGGRSSASYVDVVSTHLVERRIGSSEEIGDHGEYFDPARRRR